MNPITSIILPPLPFLNRQSPMPMKSCILCQKKIRGRADKKYCSSHCKNHYHQKMRKANTIATSPIDKFLHRNRTILVELFHSRNQKKLMIPKTKLQKLGFRFSNITGIYTNSRGKTYMLVYDYAWMEFSTDDIMLIKR